MQDIWYVTPKGCDSQVKNQWSTTPTHTPWSQTWICMDLPTFEQWPLEQKCLMLTLGPSRWTLKMKPNGKARASRIESELSWSQNQNELWCYGKTFCCFWSKTKNHKNTAHIQKNLKYNAIITIYLYKILRWKMDLLYPRIHMCMQRYIYTCVYLNRWMDDM